MNQIVYMIYSPFSNTQHSFGICLYSNDLPSLFAFSYESNIVMCSLYIKENAVSMVLLLCKLCYVLVENSWHFQSVCCELYKSIHEYKYNPCLIGMRAL